MLLNKTVKIILRIFMNLSLFYYRGTILFVKAVIVYYYLPSLALGIKPLKKILILGCGQRLKIKKKTNKIIKVKNKH
jgi:hypothetical protein